jgi:hypothetical protein
MTILDKFRFDHRDRDCDRRALARPSLESASDRTYRAGDGPRPVRAGSVPVLVF